MKSLKGMFESPTPVFAINRGVTLHGDKIGGIME